MRTSASSPLNVALQHDNFGCERPSDFGGIGLDFDRVGTGIIDADVFTEQLKSSADLLGNVLSAVHSSYQLNPKGIGLQANPTTTDRSVSRFV